MTYDIHKETMEAIHSGEAALNSLKNAKNQLDSARNWGIFDMLGGGLISGLVKRSKIENSREFMERAKYDLDRFAMELSDVQITGVGLDIEINDFVGWADILWDNFFVDWMMQDRINEARAKLDNAIFRVESILRHLKGTI